MNIHFIHALGPEVVKLVECYGSSSASSGRPEPVVIIEASQVLETLLAMTADANSEFSSPIYTQACIENVYLYRGMGAKFQPYAY